MMKQLIIDAKQKKRLSSSDTLYKNHVAKDEVVRFKKFIETHRDYRSYHLLMALRRDSPDTYKETPVEVRAAILSSALREMGLYNDWGDLDPEYWAKFMTQPEKSPGCRPARALMEIGTPAIPYLVPILEDRRDAWLAGSEEATYSIDCRYRKADWAHMFISRILKVPYPFNEDPGERDKSIAKLKRAITKKLGEVGDVLEK
jgi:hypothetical protein